MHQNAPCNFIDIYLPLTNFHKSDDIFMNESIGVSDDGLNVASERLGAYASGLPAGFDQQLAAMCSDAIKMLLTGVDLYPSLPYFKELYSKAFKELIERNITGLGTTINSDVVSKVAFYIYAIFQESNLRSNTYTDGDKKNTRIL